LFKYKRVRQGKGFVEAKYKLGRGGKYYRVCTDCRRGKGKIDKDSHLNRGDRRKHRWGFGNGKKPGKQGPGRHKLPSGERRPRPLGKKDGKDVNKPGRGSLKLKPGEEPTKLPLPGRGSLKLKPVKQPKKTTITW